MGTTSQIFMLVEGLTCELCTISAKEALEKVPGVNRAYVDLATGQARIAYASYKPSTDAMVSVLAGRGYIGKLMPLNTAVDALRNPSLVTPNGYERITLRIASLVAADELLALSKTLTRAAGVHDAGSHRRSDGSDEAIAWVVYDPKITNAGRLRTVIHEQGYRVC